MPERTKTSTEGYTKPWIILLSQARLWPVDNGMKKRVHALAQALGVEYNICISSVDQPDPGTDCSDPHYDHILPASFLTKLCKRNRARALLNPCLALKTPFHLPKRLPEVNFGQAWSLSRWAKDKTIQAVFSEYISTAATGRYLADQLHVPLYLDMHDIQHVRVAAENDHELSNVDLERVQRKEVASWKLADHLIAIQPAEAKYVETHAPHPSLLVVEHAFPSVGKSRTPPSIENRLLCVASKAKPNLHGLRFFFEKVWPDLLREEPGIRLDVVGSCKSGLMEFAKVPGVTFHGRVEDLSSFYSQAAVILNPVTYGSGLKIKTVEAIAYGKCLVTTPAGAQGLEEEAGQCFLMAEPEQLIDVILEALREPKIRMRIEANARLLYQKRFSPDACYNGLMEHLRKTHEKL